MSAVKSLRNIIGLMNSRMLTLITCREDVIIRRQTHININTGVHFFYICFRLEIQRFCERRVLLSNFSHISFSAIKIEVIRCYYLSAKFGTISPSCLISIFTRKKLCKKECTERINIRPVFIVHFYFKFILSSVLRR